AIFFLPPEASWTLKGLLIGAIAVAFLGSVSFGLENAPGGRTLAALDAGLLAAALVLLDLAPTPVALIGDATSALFLGAVISAMLMGHLYLIAPPMSLTPLFRL